ncbi:EamA family transporter, partial [Patescibacteria group bacterium]
AQFLEWPGFVLVVCGTLIHAVFIIQKKRILNTKLPADVLTTCYTLISGFLFLSLSFLFNPPKIWSVFHWPLGVFWPLFATCILNLGIQFGNTRAQKFAETALVAPIQGFQPFFALLPAWLILGEVPSKTGYFGLALVAVGLFVYSLTQKIKDPEKVPLWAKTPDGRLRAVAPMAMLFTNKGVRLAFFTAICGAAAVNCDKRAVLLSSYLFTPGVSYLFSGLIGLFFLRKESWNKFSIKRHLRMVLGAGFLYTAINTLYFSAFKYGMAIYVGSMKRLHIFFVIILSHFILKESIAKDKKLWIGVVLFSFGLFLFTVI